MAKDISMRYFKIWFLSNSYSSVTSVHVTRKKIKFSQFQLKIVQFSIYRKKTNGNTWRCSSTTSCSTSSWQLACWGRSWFSEGDSWSSVPNKKGSRTIRTSVYSTVTETWLRFDHMICSADSLYLFADSPYFCWFTIFLLIYHIFADSPYFADSRICGS